MIRARIFFKYGGYTETTFSSWAELSVLCPPSKVRRIEVLS